MYLSYENRKKFFCPKALLRIRSAAKAYEEWNKRLEIKAYLHIAHTFSSKTEINKEGSIYVYRGFKKIV